MLTSRLSFDHRWFGIILLITCPFPWFPLQCGFFPHLKLCVVFSYNSLGLCIFNIEQKNSIKKIFDKVNMVSILKKIFDMQLLFPVLIMFCSKIITHLQGQMVDVFELFDL